MWGATRLYPQVSGWEDHGESGGVIANCVRCVPEMNETMTTNNIRFYAENTLSFRHNEMKRI